MKDKTYKLRNKQGDLIATVSHNFVHAVTENVPGKWRRYKSTKGESECYEILKDFELLHKDINLLLWKGYVFIVD